MKIYRFRENNDWEGESWDFFFYAEEELADKLQELLSLDEDGIYELREYTKGPDALKVLLEEDGNTTYMDQYNWLGRLIKVPTSREDIYKENVFYKGHISDYCDQTVDL